jgi:hypothetical protein
MSGSVYVTSFVTVSHISEIKQFLLTIATSCGALHVSYVVSHK